MLWKEEQEEKSKNRAEIAPILNSYFSYPLELIYFTVQGCRERGTKLTEKCN